MNLKGMHIDIKLFDLTVLTNFIWNYFTRYCQRYEEINTLNIRKNVNCLTSSVLKCNQYETS